MTPEFIAGMVAGAGWGLFLGGILGSLFLMWMIREDDDEEKKP